MAGWQRSGCRGRGSRPRVETRLTADSYFIGQDSATYPHVNRITPAVAATVRWPFARTGARWRPHVIEPVAQLVWSETYGSDVPNEDSALVEFDEGNLLSLGRFPGHDRTETGLRAALGLNWSRYAPGGWSLGATVGRVFRAEANPDFTGASGLQRAALGLAGGGAGEERDRAWH